MQKYPGIKVSVTGGFSNVLNDSIEKQIAAGKLEVDMAFFQTVQDFVTWKKRGVLLRFKPDGFEQIMPNFRDPDGAYIALSANVLSYAYNTKLGRPRGCAALGAGFPQAAVQRQADQRLSGRRRRRALSVPPHRAEVRLGLDGPVHGQQAELHPGPPAGGAQRRHRREHGDVRCSSTAWPFKRAGPSSRSCSPRSTRRRCSPRAAASSRMRRIPMPPSSISHGISRKEQQSRTGTFSPRTDVPPPEGFKPLASYKIANDYREFILDEKLVADLRERFERYTGPPVNKGGVK